MLLLDEPLAGLDWKARMEVAETLKLLKKECTILVVSHDLRELSPLVSYEQLKHLAVVFCAEPAHFRLVVLVAQ